jgi:Ca2+-binding EF-hand superfamily protein
MRLKSLALPTATVCLQLSLAALTLTGCASFNSTSEAPLTEKERAERTENLFNAMDANGDGFLSREEMTTGLRSFTLAGGDAPRTDVVLGLDEKKGKTKKKKTMSDAEVRRAVDQAFSAQDLNLDKRISKDEFKKMVLEKSDTSAPWQEIL